MPPSYKERSRQPLQAHHEPYFGLWRGQEAKYSELGPTTHLIDIFVQEGRAQRQYDLFGDSVVRFPDKVQELARVRAELIDAYTSKIERATIL